MLSIKSLEQRLLRIEFVLSNIQQQVQRIQEIIDAERVQSTTTDDAGDSTRRQTEVEWGTVSEGSSRLRKG